MSTSAMSQSITPEEMSPVLLTGATGFVGKHTLPALQKAGFGVRCTSRNPSEPASQDDPVRWIKLDLDRPETMAPALQGVRTILYLVHGMGETGDFERRERESAERFAMEADRAGVRRIVYLGGVAPMGEPSKHLRSRLATGEILRAGPVPTMELRAGMIIGSGSLSWRIVRDLAMRLPAMLLPSWLQTRSQPIAIEDVVVALVESLRISDDRVGCYDLPGPETLTAKEILFRIAKLRNMQPWVLNVPVLSPNLSSYWLKLITSADFRVAQQLVHGLTSDLVSPDDGFWRLMPDHQRLSFDEAARRALHDEEGRVPFHGKVFEAVVRAMSRRPNRQGP